MKVKLIKCRGDKFIIPPVQANSPWGLACKLDNVGDDDGFFILGRASERKFWKNLADPFINRNEVHKRFSFKEVPDLSISFVVGFIFVPYPVYLYGSHYRVW